MSSSASPPRRRRRRTLAVAAALTCTAGLLTACGGDSGKPVLTWYLNPDGVEVLDQIAERCSTDRYDIETELLPTGATDQRVQLARRLAAGDDTTDLMNLDPVFVAEFANAGWLEEMPADTLTEDTLEGIAETVRWDDKVYAAPLWANTQVLWYRKSLAEQAGLDMTQPVTWDQVIDAADSVDGATVGVQADRYEAYVVWINALIQGAGGEIISDVEAGKDASVDIDSEAGREAAAVIQKLADSSAAQGDLSVSREGTSLPAMYSGPGEFMTNWTFAAATSPRPTSTTSAGPATRAPSTVRTPSPPSAASTSASARSASTPTWPSRRRRASPRPSRRSTSPSTPA
jgi:multiple sugar transport system substrate-binding protein